MKRKCIQNRSHGRILSSSLGPLPTAKDANFRHASSLSLHSCTSCLIMPAFKRTKLVEICSGSQKYVCTILPKVVETYSNIFDLPASSRGRKHPSVAPCCPLPVRPTALHIYLSSSMESVSIRTDVCFNFSGSHNFYSELVVATSI